MLRRISVDEIPVRRSHGFVRLTSEWAETIKAIEDGLKPYEAIELKLSPKLLGKSKWVSRSFAHNLKAYVKTKNIPLEIRFYNATDPREQAVYIIAPASEGRNGTAVPARRGPGRPPRAAAAA